MNAAKEHLRLQEAETMLLEAKRYISEAIKKTIYATGKMDIADILHKGSFAIDAALHEMHSEYDKRKTS
jgi:precorrin isomerase